MTSLVCRTHLQNNQGKMELGMWFKWQCVCFASMKMKPRVQTPVSPKKKKKKKRQASYRNTRNPK
jgi:hypothetical protein